MSGVIGFVYTWKMQNPHRFKQEKGLGWYIKLVNPKLNFASGTTEFNKRSHQDSVSGLRAPLRWDVASFLD